MEGIKFNGFQNISNVGVRLHNGNVNDPKIATSVHLLFSSNGFIRKKFDKINWWVLKNTIIVRKTIPSTYFAVMQIPGVYAGVQQLKSKFCGNHQGTYKLIL